MCPMRSHGRTVRGPWLLLLALLVASAARAQVVTVRHGHVLVRPRPGAAEHRLTSLGGVFQAVLSPDLRRVAFLRTTGDSIDTAFGLEDVTELWIAPVSGGAPRRLLRGHAAPTQERQLAGLGQPHFSPNGTRIYFESVAWPVSPAVHVVDVGTGTERFLCAGIIDSVIARGPHSGDLIVEEHHSLARGGAVYERHLVTPAGKDLGRWRP